MICLYLFGLESIMRLDNFLLFCELSSLWVQKLFAMGSRSMFSRWTAGKSAFPVTQLFAAGCARLPPEPTRPADPG